MPTLFDLLQQYVLQYFDKDLLLLYLLCELLPHGQTFFRVVLPKISVIFEFPKHVLDSFSSRRDIAHTVSLYLLVGFAGSLFRIPLLACLQQADIMVPCISDKGGDSFASFQHFLCPLWVSFREWVAEIGMAQQPEELAAVVSIAAL